jgi:hypothetical protein
LQSTDKTPERRRRFAAPGTFQAGKQRLAQAFGDLELQPLALLPAVTQVIGVLAGAQVVIPGSRVAGPAQAGEHRFLQRQVQPTGVDRLPLARAAVDGDDHRGPGCQRERARLVEAGGGDVQPLAAGDHQALEQVQAVSPARQRHRQLPRPGLDSARVWRGDQEGRVALAGDDAVIPALPLGRGERGEGGVEVHARILPGGGSRICPYCAILNQHIWL